MTEPSPYTLLLIEDDVEHQMLVKAVFARYDEYAHIAVRDSAEEGIAYVTGPWPGADRELSELPDVIVLDIQMPGIGGEGFLKWYSEQPHLSEMPVVVFTSADDENLRRRCLELGASEFLVKPLDFQELIDVVHAVLRRWREA